MWMKIDDRFWQHKKVRRLPREIRLEAIGLWLLAGSLISGEQHERGRGYVAASDVTELGGSKNAVDALVACGLWIREDVCFRFHDWNHWNPDRAALSQVRAEVGRRGGIKSGVVRRSKAEANASKQAKQTRSNSEPRIPLPEELPVVDVAATTTEVSPRVTALASRWSALTPLNDHRRTVAVLSQALTAGYSQTAIGQAMDRLATERRSLTVDTLRIELDGKPTRRPAGTSDETFLAAQALLRGEVAPGAQSGLNGANTPQGLPGAAKSEGMTR